MTNDRGLRVSWVAMSVKLEYATASDIPVLPRAEKVPSQENDT